jgi:hypothetical protein
LLDGKQLCERGPCLKGVAHGDHTLTVVRPGWKPYSRRIAIQAKTETQIRVALAPMPSRSDAVVAYVLTGAFATGGVVLGLEARKYASDLRHEIAAGTPPPDSGDSRFGRGKIFALAADATFAVAGITALTALYYTFRDKGAASTASIDVRALALRPALGPGYAGLGMEVNF